MIRHHADGPSLLIPKALMPNLAAEGLRRTDMNKRSGREILVSALVTNREKDLEVAPATGA
ncbi:MAG: hypothetical protein ACK58L_21995 [Planctomycetota bacterium]